MTQCWFNAGPASATPAQHWTNIELLCRVESPSTAFVHGLNRQLHLILQCNYLWLHHNARLYTCTVPQAALHTLNIWIIRSTVFAKQHTSLDQCAQGTVEYRVGGKNWGTYHPLNQIPPPPLTHTHTHCLQLTDDVYKLPEGYHIKWVLLLLSHHQVNILDDYYKDLLVITQTWSPMHNFLLHLLYWPTCIGHVYITILGYTIVAYHIPTY